MEYQKEKHFNMAGSYINFSKYMPPHQTSHPRETWGDLAKAVGSIGRKVVENQIESRRGLKTDLERSYAVLGDITNNQIRTNAQDDAMRMRDEVSDMIKDNKFIITPREKSEIQKKIKDLDEYLHMGNEMSAAFSEASKTAKEDPYKYQLDSEAWGDVMMSLNSKDPIERKAAYSRVSEGGNTGVPFLSLVPKDPSSLVSDQLLSYADEWGAKNKTILTSENGNTKTKKTEEWSMLSDELVDQSKPVLRDVIMSSPDSANMVAYMEENMSDKERMAMMSDYQGSQFPALDYYLDNNVDYEQVRNRLIGIEKDVDATYGLDDGAVEIDMVDGAWTFGTAAPKITRKISYFSDGKQYNETIDNGVVTEVRTGQIPGTNKKGTYGVIQVKGTAPDLEYERISKKKSAGEDLSVDEMVYLSDGPKEKKSTNTVYVDYQDIKEEPAMKAMNLKNIDSFNDPLTDVNYEGLQPQPSDGSKKEVSYFDSEEFKEDPVKAIKTRYKDGDYKWVPRKHRDLFVEAVSSPDADGAQEFIRAIEEEYGRK